MRMNPGEWMIRRVALVLALFVATAAPAQASKVVAGAGDISCNQEATPRTCHQQATAELLEAIDPDRVLTLGDNQYPSGAYADFVSFYDPTWGRFRGRTLPSPGNHEYLTPGATGYFRYFEGRAGPSGRGYYAYRLGAWYIISLNSERNMSPGSAQYTWLRDRLRGHRDVKCVLAYWHRPRFSSGSGGNQLDTKPLWDLLYRYHADVVLSGHDHDYERFRRKDPSGNITSRGIREFVVGTGGHSLTGWGKIKAGSIVRYNKSFGVLKLTLWQASYSWRFIPEEGPFTDRGWTKCG
jgi:Calcineurin-like phosphoesterase